MNYEELKRKYQGLLVSNGRAKKRIRDLTEQIKQLSYFISKNIIDELVKEKKPGREEK